MICGRCKEDKLESDFSRNRAKRSGLSVYCRSCKAVYAHDDYVLHREYYLRKNQERNIRIRKELYTKVLEYLRNHPCLDCGEADPIVLEFHHLDRSQKYLSIGVMLRHRYPWKTIKAEIDKCCVLCSNCHKRRTAKQVRSYRTIYTGFVQG